jgi:hypothetical protein
MPHLCFVNITSMVRNPGLIPGLESIRAGDVGTRRKNMYEMMVRLYASITIDLTPLVGFLVSIQAKVQMNLSWQMQSLLILHHTLTFIAQKSSESHCT